jgi:hypothetical protein
VKKSAAKRSASADPLDLMVRLLAAACVEEFLEELQPAEGGAEQPMKKHKKAAPSISTRQEGAAKKRRRRHAHDTGIHPSGLRQSNPLRMWPDG